MAGNPALKVYVDWDDDNTLDAGEDISAYAIAPAGGRVLAIARGTNLDGGSATPGTLALRLTNTDNRFTPGNTGGPYGSNVKAGKRIRVDAVYNSTTYPLFVGRITSIAASGSVPLAVTVMAEDLLGRAGEVRSTKSLDATSSLAEFREELIEQAFGSGTHALSHSGPESSKPPVAADAESLLGILADLNEATRTIDFVRPLASPTFGETASHYVTIDRASLQGLAAAASYAADQIAEIDDWNADTELKVNYQLAQAEPYTSVEYEEEVWRSARVIGLSPGQTRIKIAKWSDPLIIGRGRRPAERARLEYDATGTAGASAVYYSTSARLTLNGNGSGGELRRLRILAFPAEQTGLGYEESDLTAGDPMGVYAGREVSSRFLANDADAKGLAVYLTHLGTQPLVVRPRIRLRANLLPDTLQREPGQRITVAHGRLGLTAQDILIESTELTMDAGGVWQLTARGRKYPFASVVTIGGTAAQGVGGTASLAY
jgi:hypothetical protein